VGVDSYFSDEFFSLFTFADTAKQAVLSLYGLLNSRNLLNSHMDTRDGRWIDEYSGIGSYVDSYIEYLAKGWIMAGDMGSSDGF
jgi:hypothetical protein